MKCERCGNATKWVGSLMSGHLECEHCANDDELTELIMSNGSSIKFEPAEDTQLVVGSGGSGGSAGNPLRCPNPCCMNGGSGYCSCYGEPSILKDPLADNKLNPYGVCSHCGDSISNCSCRVQQLTYQFLVELKGEFKC